LPIVKKISPLAPLTSRACSSTPSRHRRAWGEEPLTWMSVDLPAPEGPTSTSAGGGASDENVGGSGGAVEKDTSSCVGSGDSTRSNMEGAARFMFR
jgi:hypothetical protein